MPNRAGGARQARTRGPGLQRVGRFVAVGGAGFVIDTGTLTLLHYGAGIDPFSARAVSTPLAMLATWRLNRALTFGASDAPQAAEGARYMTVATLAALLNYAIYSGILLAFDFVPPPVAVAISTSIVMAISYLGYSRLVFGSSLPEDGAAGASATKGGGSRSQSR